MPDISSDGLVYTFHLRPGQLFTPDPAFKGVKRELTAADYIYSLKRHYDPRWKSPSLYLLEGAKVLGLSEIRQRALAAASALGDGRVLYSTELIDPDELHGVTGIPVDAWAPTRKGASGSSRIVSGFGTRTITSS